MDFSSAAAADKARLASRIRRARRDAALTQLELAVRVGVTSSAVARWEHPDGTCPEILRLDAIAAALGVNVQWLAVGRGRQKPDSGGNSETPAVKLDFYAQDSAEEVLLQRFRALPPRAKQLLADFLEELTPGRRGRTAEQRPDAAQSDRKTNFTLRVMQQR